MKKEPCASCGLVGRHAFICAVWAAKRLAALEHAHDDDE